MRLNMPGLMFERFATSPSVRPMEFRRRRTVAPIWRETLAGAADGAALLLP